MRFGTLLVTIFYVCETALATWSILLVDIRTKEVAVSAATCVAPLDLTRVNPVIVVGVGGGTSLNISDSSGTIRRATYDGLLEGNTPDEIIEQLRNSSTVFRESGQLAAADIFGRVANYTGPFVNDWANALSGSRGDLFYSIQGNLLTGNPVLEMAESAVLETQGDLAEKIMAGMEAARSMGGDGRCSCGSSPDACGSPPPDVSQSARAGYLMAARPGDIDGDCLPEGCATGDYWLKFNVISVSRFSPIDPVVRFREMLTTWREELRGRPDAVQSETQIFPGILPADGESKALMSITLVDWDGSPVTNNGISVTVDHDSDSNSVTTIGPVETLGEGKFSVELTAGLAIGVDHFQITIEDGNRPVQITPAPSVRVLGLPLNQLYFAQFADGQELFSQIILFSLEEAMETTATLTLKDDDGQPLTVDLNGEDVTGSFDVAIPPSGLIQLKTDSIGNLVAGSVTVTSDKPVAGVILFGGSVGLAGVGSSLDLSDGFTAPMEVLIDADGTTRLIDTGIAVMNLETEAVDLTLMLVDADGNEVATTTVTLEGMGHLASFLSRLTDWDPVITLADLVDFRGTLMVTSTGRIAATVIQSRPGQFATMPVEPK